MSSHSTATLIDPAIVPGSHHGRDQASVLFVPAHHDQTSVGARLGELGLSVTSVSDPAEAIRALKKQPFTLALVQLGDERTAVPAIRAIRAQQPHLLLAGLMDPSRPLVAAEAIRAGVAELL